MRPQPCFSDQRKSSAGLGFLALALAIGLAFGAAGVVAGSPEKKTGDASNETTPEAADKDWNDSRKENLETLKDLLERFKKLRWKHLEATRKKTEQAKTLEDLKNRPAGGRFVGQYFHRQEIFRLQSELHLAIEEAESCALEAFEVAEEIGRRAPAIRKALAVWLKKTQDSLDSEDAGAGATARGKRIAEVEEYLSLLDRIADNPAKAEQILVKAVENKMSVRPPGNPVRQFMGFRQRNQGARGPRPGSALDAKIRALEYEQESLYRQWLRNENTLRALRKMQESRQDESGPESPPFAPRQNRRGRDGVIFGPGPREDRIRPAEEAPGLPIDEPIPMPPTDE